MRSLHWYLSVKCPLLFYAKISLIKMNLGFKDNIIILCVYSTHKLTAFKLVLDQALIIINLSWFNACFRYCFEGVVSKSHCSPHCQPHHLAKQRINMKLLQAKQQQDKPVEIPVERNVNIIIETQKLETMNIYYANNLCMT